MKRRKCGRYFRMAAIVYPIFLFFCPILSVAQVEKIADGFQFVEGPLWRDGGLLFSDMNGNTVYRWTPDSGATVYYSPSGNSNGLALDLEGRLLMALQGGRKVVRLEPDRTLTILASEFEGKKLNSPNDLTVKTDGSIFFTDPPYGISTYQQELNFCGIFRLSPSGKLQVLDKTLSRPNGIDFSPDESLLYVSDAEARIIYVWDVASDTTIENKRVFARIKPVGYADGLKTDPDGRLFATGPTGVWVFDPNGVALDTILVPGQTTNCNWGDADGNTLYITSGTAVYRTRNPFITSTIHGQSGRNPDSFCLYNNYPNPFNPTTRISYQIPREGRVTLSLFNVRGAKIQNLMDAQKSAGSHQFDLNLSGLSSGVYLVSLQFENDVVNQKVNFIR
jgi:gluconolactonase